MTKKEKDYIELVNKKSQIRDLNTTLSSEEIIEINRVLSYINDKSKKLSISNCSYTEYKNRNRVEFTTQSEYNEEEKISIVLDHTANDEKFILIGGFVQTSTGYHSRIIMKLNYDKISYSKDDFNSNLICFIVEIENNRYRINLRHIDVLIGVSSK